MHDSDNESRLACFRYILFDSGIGENNPKKSLFSIYMGYFFFKNQFWTSSLEPTFMHNKQMVYSNIFHRLKVLLKFLE